MRKITHIIVHHSAGHGGTLQEIRMMHMNDHGWSDIGYHGLITNGKDIEGKASEEAKDGVFFFGRPEHIAGAHCSNRYGKHNSYSLGVCITGNYEIDTPSPTQLKRLAALLTTWCRHYEIPCTREFIKGHREMSGHTSNACPGTNLFLQLDHVVELATCMLSKIG